MCLSIRDVGSNAHFINSGNKYYFYHCYAALHLEGGFRLSARCFVERDLPPAISPQLASLQKMFLRIYLPRSHLSAARYLPVGYSNDLVPSRRMFEAQADTFRGFRYDYLPGWQKSNGVGWFEICISLTLRNWLRPKLICWSSRYN